jgi:Poly(R)-hydroxyalkanoic acid synthase subunit (PHA_synth_III_E)
MTKTFDDGGVEAVYNFWLGLIPQFFSQIGVNLPAVSKAAPASAPNAVHAADWLAPWAAAMPFLAGATGKSAEGGAAPTAAQMFAPWGAMLAPYPSAGSKAEAAATAAPGATSMFGPWAAALPFVSGAPGAAAGLGGGAAAAAMQPFQVAQQSWLDFMTQMGGASPQSFITGFDRTFGGLLDALGFGPVRKLQGASQDLAGASLAQSKSRAAYAMLVQGAFTSGLERLMVQLGKMADGGERVESVLTLLRMWAVHTEQAVHEVLQSEEGLAATASLSRAGLAYRRKLQHVAAIVADSLDLATRRELDEVYREIHELKRELRSLRAPAPSRPAAVIKERKRAKKRKAKP